MTVATEQFRYVQKLVMESSAIVLSEDKNYLVESRLAPLARSLGLANVDGVVDHMRKRRDLRLEQKVIEAMTTNETSWFRDRKPFDALQYHILPALLEANSASRHLRIWSAACSSGQELYSLAILLEENFPQLHHGWQVELVGTDLNTEMVDKAAGGLFSTLEVNRGLPASLLVRYFTQEGTCWRAGASLRARTRFAQLNLIKMWPALPTFDIVLLRNVLIYFDVSTKRQVLNRVVRQLAPRGYLLLGTGESPTGLGGGLETVNTQGAVFYRAK
jgi:chemotaxis protein methyltransferase CheR